METLIGILLISIAAISEAIMDKTQFHYHRSIFRYWKYQQFFDPAISWKNKWKNQDAREGERFSFSSTILVAFTDAWHLFVIRTSYRESHDARRVQTLQPG